MKLIISLIFCLASIVNCAEPAGRESEIENGTQQQLKALKGKIIVVEGMMWGWGSGWPGLGARIVLPTGQRIYFTETKFLKESPNGRTVRIHGQLTLRHMRGAAGRFDAGYPWSFDYWTIDDPVVEVINKIVTDDVAVYAPPPNKMNTKETEQPVHGKTPAAPQPPH